MLPSSELLISAAVVPGAKLDAMTTKGPFCAVAVPLIVNEGVAVVAVCVVVGIEVVDARKVGCGRVAGRVEDVRGLRHAALRVEEERGMLLARRSRRGFRLEEPVEFVRYIITQTSIRQSISQSCHSFACTRSLFLRAISRKTPRRAKLSN